MLIVTFVNLGVTDELNSIVAGPKDLNEFNFSLGFKPKLLIPRITYMNSSLLRIVALNTYLIYTEFSTSWSRKSR